MKTIKIKRFYIMPEIWVTVTQSQVFNWIKLVKEKGISTDCISVTTDKISKEKVKKIENLIGGKFIEVHNFKRIIVSDLFLGYILLKYYLINVFKYDKIIFQTRLGSSGFTYAILNWLPKTRFIFEARGAGNEEISYAREGEKDTYKLKIKKYYSETSENLLIKKSNKIICVSHALKIYHIKKHLISEEKFSVLPGAADSDLFFYNKNLRDRIRKELKLTFNDILIVYSGRLEMKWEIPDKIFTFFKNLNDKNSRFRLLLITPDADLANDFNRDFERNKMVIVKKVELVDVNNYLNAADAGLLLREDIPMNNVASPTKFAEYLMSGLPVIISAGVHDFANNINETGFGVVVSGLEEISDNEYVQLLNSLKINRKDITTWGLHNLSKEFLADGYVKILSNI